MKIRLPAIAALLFATPALSQLDLGSHAVPQDEVDAYLEPFYRLAASGLGSDRHAPAGGAGWGWHAGLGGAAVPIPDGDPFDDADAALLPILRLEGGARWRALGAMARGMAHSDPRLGKVATFGAGLSLGRAFRAGTPAEGGASAALVLGWDRLVFESDYVYEYRSPLGVLDGEVPGDYTLTEDLLAAGLQGGLGLGPVRVTAEAFLERAYGRFRYLYVDPVDGEPSRVSSRLGLWGFRAAGGLGWKGFRLQGGWAGHPYAAIGWAWGTLSRRP